MYIYNILWICMYIYIDISAMFIPYSQLMGAESIDRSLSSSEVKTTSAFSQPREALQLSHEARGPREAVAMDETWWFMADGHPPWEFDGNLMGIPWESHNGNIAMIIDREDVFYDPGDNDISSTLGSKTVLGYFETIVIMAHGCSIEWWPIPPHTHVHMPDMESWGYIILCTLDLLRTLPFP